MPNGRYSRQGAPQAQGFYSPYSKNIQWGQGIGELLQRMQMMKQFRQAQEQQKWQRGITEQQIEMQRQRLNQPNQPSIAEQRWGMADANVARGIWTPEQGRNYKMTGQTPEKPVTFPKTTIENVQKEFGITPEEWKNLDTRQKGGYIGEYQLRTRPKAAGRVSPEEAQAKIDFNRSLNMTKAAGAKLNSYMKGLTPRAKATAAEQYMQATPDTLRARVELANVSQLGEYLERITSSSMTSGRPLMDEYKEAVNSIIKAKPEDIRSGKLYQDIKQTQFKSAGVEYGKIDKHGFYKGQIRKSKDGRTWQYLGDENWKPLTEEELRKYKQPWISEKEANRPITNYYKPPR